MNFVNKTNCSKNTQPKLVSLPRSTREGVPALPIDPSFFDRFSYSVELAFDTLLARRIILC